MSETTDHFWCDLTIKGTQFRFTHTPGMITLVNSNCGGSPLMFSSILVHWNVDIPALFGSVSRFLAAEKTNITAAIMFQKAVENEFAHSHSDDASKWFGRGNNPAAIIAALINDRDNAVRTERNARMDLMGTELSLHLASGNHIQAIKLVREMHHQMGLRDAKQLVDCTRDGMFQRCINLVEQKMNGDIPSGSSIGLEQFMAALNKFADWTLRSFQQSTLAQDAEKKD